MRDIRRQSRDPDQLYVYFKIEGVDYFKTKYSDLISFTISLP